MLKTFIHIFRLMSILISTVDLNFKKSIHCYIIYMSFLWSFYFSCNWKNPSLFKALITNQRKTSRSFDRCPFLYFLFRQKISPGTLPKYYAHFGGKIGPDSFGKWFINVFFLLLTNLSTKFFQGEIFNF